MNKIKAAGAARSEFLAAHLTTQAESHATKITNRLVERLLARSLVLALLDLDYSEEIALARALAASDEGRAA